MTKTEELEARIKKLEHQMEELAREVVRLYLHKHPMTVKDHSNIISVIGKPIDGKSWLPTCDCHNSGGLE